jgi:monofunctional glycosyltransferase
MQVVTSALRKGLRWAAYVFVAAVALFLVVQLWFLGHVLYWVNHNPESTRFMELRLETLRAKRPNVKLAHQWVEYKYISLQLKRAIIAAEDGKFIDHEGFDWEGIQRALDKNQKQGRVVAGGSTITQQLAKNLFLSGERSFIRKGQEALITAMLELCMDKRRIFEIYMNVVEWGEGIFGAEAAARHYFGVPAAKLSDEQAARLAAMLPRPRFFQRNPQSNYLAEYSAIILERMPGSRVP